MLRGRDIVARLGGDEFAIIQHDTTTEDQAAQLADRVIRTIARPHQVMGHTVDVGASIGIVLAPKNGVNADELIKKADVALYEAKAAGRATFRLFRGTATVGGRTSLEEDLREAQPRGELELYYQPIINATTREIVGFEALMRWNHPTLGMILPADFISLAEETGVIVEIGAWAMIDACREAMRWSMPVKVTVNLSPLQFERGDLYSVIVDALTRSGLPAQRLEVEITEGLLLRDDFATTEVLHKLRRLGVSIALDDFGTAYASLSYLRSFPFDKIKIDRSFMRDLEQPNQKECLAIVNAVAGLARQLQMKTVVEGVENINHVNSALVTGCDEVQGFFFSKPVPASEVELLLSTQPSKIAATKRTGERRRKPTSKPSMPKKKTL